MLDEGQELRQRHDRRLGEESEVVEDRATSWSEIAEPDLAEHPWVHQHRSLANRVGDLRMEDHVQFIDRFVAKSELAQWLQAADVFVTPYPNMAQIVSGTLSYAMGAGRAVVSTPYAYAAELLADGRGVLVPPGSSEGLAASLNQVLGDPVLRAAIGRRAYAHSRGMVWSAVGAQYTALFAELVAEAAEAAEDAEDDTPTSVVARAPVAKRELVAAVG